MKKWVQYAALGVGLMGISLGVSSFYRKMQEEPELGPQERHQSFVEQEFERRFSAETRDKAEAAVRSPETAADLEQAEYASSDSPPPTSPEMPESAPEPYSEVISDSQARLYENAFNDFSAMREEAVRNPRSAENLAVMEALVSMRERRLVNRLNESETAVKQSSK